MGLAPHRRRNYIDKEGRASFLRRAMARAKLIPGAVISPMICTKCASEIPSGFKFCGNCGQKLDAMVQTPPRPAQWLTPFVGRDAELRQLVERWGTAHGGELWVEVRGEAGVGKTRLVQEVAKRLEGRRLLTVIAKWGTQYRPFGMVRRLVRTVVCEITGQVSQPETPEAFAAALVPLGYTLTPFIDALWRLVAPSRLSMPALGPTPQMLRWSLERGVAILLGCLAEHTRDLALFFDAYELADETSVALFKSLGAQPAGWPMPVIVACRDKGGAAWRPEAEIRLGPLADEAAGELLDRLTHGAQLPEALRQDILARAAGIPLHMEEMVRMLVHKGILTPAKDGIGWVCEPRAASAPLRVSYCEAIVDQLEQPERDVLCQCAVQGTEFDLDVLEAVQRRMHWWGPSVRTLLPALERRGLVQSINDDGPLQWSFSQTFIQEACYEALAPSARRTLHGKTAEALCELAGEQGSVPPELLAYHYEHAGQWIPAAAATLRAGHCASEMFLNEVAVRLYQRAADILDRPMTPSEEAIQLAILAHGGAARVHLRVGAYGLVEQDVKKMRVMAVRPGDRAEADRLAALAYSHIGRTDEAERLLLSAVALARNDDAAADVLLHALCDLAEFYCGMGRTDAAREALCECRAIARSEESLALADDLESRIADVEGRFADASALCAHAHAAAQRAGSLSELARTSLGLGNYALDLGDYEAAQRHFERALEIWELTGEVEFIAMAYNNLGNLAMSRSDFEAAQAHHERARAACQAIGNIDGAALAQLNLALGAIEEGDLAGAVTVAEASLAMLNSSGNAQLRGWVLAILGEGRLECGDAPGAQREFDRIIQNYDEAHHPVAVAHAWRGLGRVALMRGAATDALGLFERARAGFERLRAQEAARTALYQAMALRQLGESQRAGAVLEQAREQFIAMPMRAGRDAERAERLLRELYAASQSNGS